MTPRRLILGGLLAASMGPFIPPSLAHAQAPEAAMNTQRFEFVSAGNRLSGFVDTPTAGTAKALIIIIHGYGESRPDKLRSKDIYLKCDQAIA